MKEHRPWGYYEVLDDQGDHKIKRIVVYPGKRLSLQRHRKRAEHWFVVYGEALVTLDQLSYHLHSGASINIPRGALHRIMNPGKEEVTVIEIQTGEYFGEEDIERVEDDYGRA